jgi:hypothetical protein
MGERSDEVAKLASWQCSINPAVSFGQLRIVVLCAEHDLHRASAAHQTREMLDAACAGGGELR